MALSDAQRAPDLRARLPRVDAKAAALGNVLLAALNGATCAAGILSARIEPTPAGEVAFRFVGGLAVRPLIADGAPTLWTPAEAAPELPEALLELSRLEPLLAGVEQALGLALEPERLERWASPTGGLALRVAVREGSGRELHAVRLFAPPDVMIAPPPRSRVSARCAGAASLARVPLRLVADGPSAPVKELGLLAPGDLIPTGGANGLQARLIGAPHISAFGRWRPGERQFICEGSMDETNKPDPPAAKSGLPAELTVRLNLELGGVQVTLGELAALAPGAVLKVEISGDAPRVEITAGGAHLAVGRLVALGEAYGVLIDEVHENIPAVAAEGA